MKIRLEYHEGPADSAGVKRPVITIVDMETGQRLKRVQRLTLELSAHDIVPRLQLEIVHEELQLVGFPAAEHTALPSLAAVAELDRGKAIPGAEYDEALQVLRELRQLDVNP